MISTTDFKNGMSIVVGGTLYTIVEYQHIKPGKGGAFVRTKLRNMLNKTVIDMTFRAGDKIEQAYIENKKVQYLYHTDKAYYFMDTENYEQAPLTLEQLGDTVNFLKENMVVKVLYHSGAPITVDLPIFVELMIAKTDPGFKGDTASGGSKPAVLETGASIKVPFHLTEGDIIKVDTRTSEYIERVK